MFCIVLLQHSVFHALKIDTVSENLMSIFLNSLTLHSYSYLYLTGMFCIIQTLNVVLMMSYPISTHIK